MEVGQTDMGKNDRPCVCAPWQHQHVPYPNRPATPVPTLGATKHARRYMCGK